ncbi:hypothetical protein WME89_41815 [Sorangium sp. So ce321]|uniref:hypothetical protein n=1 Tax=Sorangium sp. So ce321 TaxID=3133300 RepID=UPI003F5E4235
MNYRLGGALLAVLTCGCSIVDPSDRDELRDRIAAMPLQAISELKRWGMNTAAVRWLRSKDEKDQVGKLQCRYQAGGQWTNWADQEPPLTVADMLYHLIKTPLWITYEMAKDQWESVERQARKTDLMNSLPIPGGATVECRFVWDFRYDPEKVPVELTDPDEFDSDDIIDAMIAVPAPPPGWAFPELVPLLCPLGAGPGWGCPPTPTDPTGGQPTDPTGGQPGDRP